MPDSTSEQTRVLTPDENRAEARSESEVSAMEDQTGTRLAVRKTYKLFIGGAFPRSESGRSYVVSSAEGEFLANAAWAAGLAR